jgi:hypothetical protein
VDYVKLEWVRVDDLIVPVLAKSELAKLASYIIFSEMNLDKELLFAKIEHKAALSRPEKIYLTRYLRTMSALGLIEFDGEQIIALVPPIPVSVYKESVERAVRNTGKKELARKFKVSERTVEAWKAGVVPRRPEVFLRLMRG